MGFFSHVAGLLKKAASPITKPAEMTRRRVMPGLMKLRDAQDRAAGLGKATLQHMGRHETPFGRLPMARDTVFNNGNRRLKVLRR